MKDVTNFRRSTIISAVMTETLRDIGTSSPEDIYDIYECRRYFQRTWRMKEKPSISVSQFRPVGAAALAERDSEDEDLSSVRCRL